MTDQISQYLLSVNKDVAWFFKPKLFINLYKYNNVMESVCQSLNHEKTTWPI